MTFAAVALAAGVPFGADRLPEPLRTLTAMAVVLAVLAALLGLLGALRPRLHPEAARKLLHVGMGLTVLPFPWLFADVWPVLVLAAGAAGLMLALRRFPALKRTRDVVHGVDRASWGEIYYPLAVGGLWVLSQGQWVLWVVPILILTLADALAAVIGISYGRHRFVSADGTKSVEGSVAFFAIAFLSAHVPLLLFTDVGRTETLLIAVILGLLVMLLELLSWDGLDNLFIPLGAFAMLSIYLELPVAALANRLVATVVLLGFAFGWRRRTSLDDSALVAAAFFGYLAWAVGGAAFLLPPLVLFLAHCVLWPRTGDGRPHTVRTILAITSAGIGWLLVYAGSHWSGLLVPYAVAFGFQVARAGISFATACRPDSRLRRWGTLAWLAPAAWAATVIPAILLAGQPRGWMTLLAFSSLAAICVAAGIYTWLAPRLFCPRPYPPPIQLTGALLALFASAITATVAMVALP